eukprot:1533227-Rhodomonas_salina.1
MTPQSNLCSTARGAERMAGAVRPRTCGLGHGQTPSRHEQTPSRTTPHNSTDSELPAAAIATQARSSASASGSRGGVWRDTHSLPPTPACSPHRPSSELLVLVLLLQH